MCLHFWLRTTKLFRSQKNFVGTFFFKTSITQDMLTNIRYIMCLDFVSVFGHQARELQY